jgi:NAD(P)H-dependent FMN reductase
MKIAIISGSTRLNRKSHRVALAAEKYLKNKGCEPVVLDLAALNLPMFEETISKMAEVPAGLRAFADAVKSADAAIFVSPEYNGTYTSALKNAVDFLSENQFSKKVVGIASVSAGPGAGMRGAMNLQELVLGVGGFAIPQMWTIGEVDKKFDENGELLDPSFAKKTDFFFDGLLWLAEAVAAKK